tara:strand:+ start:872 stop:1159 length:288 start_codon:yes stop_codon:yes gene_type:complete
MAKNTLFYTPNNRDRLMFAAHAMQSLIMRYGEDSVEKESLDEAIIFITKSSYQIADKMMMGMEVSYQEAKLLFQEQEEKKGEQIEIPWSGETVGE